MQAYDELSFSIGAIIAVKSAPESGKWTGYLVGSSGKRQDGVFYRTYVSIMERIDSSKSNGNVLFLGKLLNTPRVLLLTIRL